MKKRKLLSILLAASVAVCSISAVASAEGTGADNIDPAAAPEYKEATNEFFANGTPITINAATSEGKTATITWDGGSQEIDENDTVYGGSDTTASNIHLASTSITMNGGTVYNITGGNKTKNEKACDYSIIDQVTLDINGGVITLGVYGIDNQNTAFGTDVRKELNGKSYKNYRIGNLDVSIDGATVNSFRGVTSYAYAENVDVTVGQDSAPQLKEVIWGTNGVIENATFTMYSGTTNLASSILRATILNKMTYNILGGKVGDIYAGSYYPYEETAAGSDNWDGWGAGYVDYGFANSIEITIGQDVVYNDIISGFQYRPEDIETFKTVYPDSLWCIEDLNENAPIVLNLASAPTAKGDYSVIDSSASYVTTNWQATVEEPTFPTIDPSEPVENVTAGVDADSSETLSSETEQIISDVLQGNSTSAVNAETQKALEDAVKGGQTISTKVEATTVLDSSAVPAEDKSGIETFVQAMDKDAVIAQYLDLKVLLLADNQEIGEISQLSNPITFTLAIPDSLKADGRVFTVVRVHNGQEEALKTIMNEDGTISFSTDRFSTYALVYTDAETTPGEDPTNPPEDPTTPDDPENPNQPTTPDDTTDPDQPTTGSDGPQTGDTSNVMLWVGILVLAACAMTVTLGFAATKRKVR